MPVALAHLTQAPGEEWSLEEEEEAPVEVGNVKGGLARGCAPRTGGRKGAGGDKGQDRGGGGGGGGVSARGGDAHQAGRDAGSQQAGQHDADELQQRQPQSRRGKVEHVGADEGRHLAEAAVAVQAACAGRATLAAPAGPTAAEGHGAVLPQPPGRGEPVAVALHAAAGQGALQSVQGVRRPLILPVGEQGPAQPLLEALRDVPAVEERREPGRQPGRKHGGQEGAIGAQEAAVLRGGAEAAQEGPDEDGGAGGQEDGGGAGAAIGRQRQVAAQGHLGPEADDEHDQPRRPEDQAEGHEGQLEHGHGARGPRRWRRRGAAEGAGPRRRRCRGGSGLPGSPRCGARQRPSPAAADASRAALPPRPRFSVPGAGARPAAALVRAAGLGGTGQTGRDGTGRGSPPLPLPSPPVPSLSPCSPLLGEQPPLVSAYPANGGTRRRSTYVRSLARFSEVWGVVNGRVCVGWHVPPDRRRKRFCKPKARGSLPLQHAANQLYPGQGKKLFLGSIRRST